MGDWKVILGTSNVKRNYDPKSSDEPYVVKKCCRMESFKAEAAMLTSENEYIIVSVFENILVDAVEESVAVNHVTDVNDVTTVDNVRVHADVLRVTIEVADVIKVIGVSCPKAKVAVMAPLTRPASAWYTEHYLTILTNCNIAIDNLANVNPAIVYIDSFAREAQTFGADGVHLTSDSAQIFLTSMIVAAENHFMGTEAFGGPVGGDLIDEMDVGLKETTSSWADDTIDKIVNLASIGTKSSAVGGKGGKNSSDLTVASLSERVKCLEARIAELEKIVGRKTYSDNKMLSRIREELDQISNMKKEDRVMMMGLTSTVPAPRLEIERNAWARQMVIEALKKFDKKPREGSSILYVKAGKREGGVLNPPIEVRFDSRETALHVRSAFVQTKKANVVDLGTIHVSNVVTLATRVRADILRAVAEQRTRPNKLSLFVSAFNSRPVVHIKELPNGPTSVMTFSDVIERFGEDIKQDQLQFAYRRAGRAFQGQMAQNFVVMKESGVGRVFGSVVSGSVSGVAATPRGGTRSLRSMHRGVGGSGLQKGGGTQRAVQCFGCKQMGHIHRFCPTTAGAFRGNGRGRGGRGPTPARKRTRSGAGDDPDIEVVHHQGKSARHEWS